MSIILGKLFSLNDFLRKNYFLILFFIKIRIMVKYSEETDNLRLASPIKNDYYTVLICSEGNAKIKIGFHHFEITSGTITILPPDVLISTQNVSDNFKVKQVLFTKVFLQKIILKEGIIDELLLLNTKYPPMYELNESYTSVKEKFVQIKRELNSKYAYHLDIIRLIIMEILYEYNRACEYCLLGFEKTMNRNYQLTYEFKKLVDNTLVATYASGEINQIYNKWFMSPIPPKNINMNFQMSDNLKDLLANPHDGAQPKTVAAAASNVATAVASASNAVASAAQPKA